MEQIEQIEQIEKKLNWREACALLGCGRNRFYAMIREGLLPAYRLRGKKNGLWVYEKDCIALKERICLTD